MWYLWLSGVHGMGNELIKSILMASQVNYSKKCALIKKNKKLIKTWKQRSVLIT
jgi:hypothetical protein